MSDSPRPLDPSWYTGAVVHRLHVGTCLDANDDGSGDCAWLADRGA